MLQLKKLKVVPYSREVINKGVCSRNEELNRYFRTQAGQDVRKKVSACYIAIDKETQENVGFYTISATAVQAVDIPEELRRKSPRYPLLPAAKIGRLAVAVKYERQGVGSYLLVDAFSRCASSGIGVYAVIVDAKDESVAAFYRRFGFCSLESSGLNLFFPMNAFEKTYRVS